jgi:CubicO group peptidase (beta-lactamase class C family)
MKSLFFLCTALLVNAPAQAQSPETAKIDSVVHAEMASQKIPGVGVAVIRGSQTVLAKGYGLANVEHRVPVTTQTIFQSGSVGKQFTSTAVMQLVEAGKIQLDDPITKYLADAPAAWRDITIRHLLTHTSGIPDYTTEAFDYRRDYTEEELVKLAYAVTLEFPAGTRWNYSNTGYVLLGAIIRKAGGRFYGDHLAEHVFKPAGMTTARVITEADIVPNRAAGYQLVKGELKNQEWVSPVLNTTADGSLYLSLDDMIAWDRALRAGTLLKAESWKTVYDPVRLRSGNRYPYGFAWAVDSIAGQQRIGHGGSWQGFRAHIDRYQGDDVTVIVLANLAQGDATGIARRIAAALNPALRPAELKPIADTEPAQTAKLRQAIELLRSGSLKPSDFAYVRAGFFPGAAKHYAELVKEAGTLERVVVMNRTTLGDDRISEYELHFEKGVYQARIGVAADGRISTFGMRKKAL